MLARRFRRTHRLWLTADIVSGCGDVWGIDDAAVAHKRVPGRHGHRRALVRGLLPPPTQGVR
jgi:hypothetical protein